MRKLAALVLLVAGCAIGFPCLATAADVVDINCRPTTAGFTIIFSGASQGSRYRGRAGTMRLPVCSAKRICCPRALP
jgi:hypothetical protein